MEQYRGQGQPVKFWWRVGEAGALLVRELTVRAGDSGRGGREEENKDSIRMFHG